MRPRPQRGQGWRKGSFKISKKDFYRAVSEESFKNLDMIGQSLSFSF